MGERVSYDPPRGKERSLGAFLDRRLEPMCLSTYDIRAPSFSGFIGHALEGVRTNGTQRLTTVNDILRHLTTWRKQLDCHVKEIRALRDKVRKIEIAALDRFEKDFRLCPTCKGKQGNGESGRFTWVDCETCDGRGLVRKVSA